MVGGRTFTVLGARRSGLAAARLLLKLGAESVMLSDSSPDPDMERRCVALQKEFPGRVGLALGTETVRTGDVVVVSPGIPPSAPIFRRAERVSQELIGEIELFYRLYDGDIVAVTGTNGKSTITLLIQHILRTAGIHARAAGNLGNPVCELLLDNPCPVVVAEVSCFQLITTRRFRPLVAVISNIAEDHVDYHGNLSAYERAKARIVANQASTDFFVRNRDDVLLSAWCTKTHPFAPSNGQKVLDVSLNGPVQDGAWSWGRTMYVAEHGESRHIVYRHEFNLPGNHNLLNGLLAMAAVRPFDVSDEAMTDALRTFEPLPHRLEEVATLGRVRFINDSKATNPHSTIVAIRSFDDRLVLIAGGFEKGLSLDELADVAGRRCRGVVLIGAMAERMRSAFADRVPQIERARDLDEAVSVAYEMAGGEGVVLFSPGSSSFDMFRDYEERGERFKEAVRRLCRAHGQKADNS